MKICKLIVLFFFFPFFAFTQQLSGIWIGSLTNDSLQARNNQKFEMALTEYRGNVFGYSYSTFIINDTLYYVVKRVKGTIEGNVCEVTDDEMISNNLFGKRDKRVKQTTTFRMNPVDSVWYVEGTWKTNKTKEFYSITGTISLKQEKDFDKSALLQHLGDLKLDNTLAFYKPEKKVYLSAPPKTRAAKQEPDIAKSNKNTNTVIKTNNTAPVVTVENPGIADVQNRAAETNIKKPDATVATTLNNEQKKTPDADIKTKNVVPTVIVENPAIADVQNRAAETNIKKPDATVATTLNNEQKKTPDADIKTKNVAPTVIVENPAIADVQNRAAETNIKKPDATVATTLNNEQKKTSDADLKNKKVVPAVIVENPAIADVQNRAAETNIKKPDATVATTLNNEQKKTSDADIKTKNAVPAVMLENPAIADAQKKTIITDSSAELNADIASGPWQERKKHIIQTVNYKADSLVLSLYDNGEIDGDTVSVFVNGEMIIERQGLKAAALKKTIYLKPSESEEVEILLFAENLGSLPPNTGLLIIRDGEDRYEIRFSADYDLSPAIVLKRKKNLSP